MSLRWKTKNRGKLNPAPYGSILGALFGYAVDVIDQLLDPESIARFVRALADGLPCPFVCVVVCCLFDSFAGQCAAGLLGVARIRLQLLLGFQFDFASKHQQAVEDLPVAVLAEFLLVAPYSAAVRPVECFEALPNLGDGGQRVGRLGKGVDRLAPSSTWSVASP